MYIKSKKYEKNYVQIVNFINYYFRHFWVPVHAIENIPA